MSTTQVGEHTPNSQSGAQDVTDATAAEFAPLPAAPTVTVREVAAQQPEGVVYRYVAKPATDMWHIYEKTTGERVTTHPLRSRAEAEDACVVYNRLQTPPR